MELNQAKTQHHSPMTAWPNHWPLGMADSQLSDYQHKLKWQTGWRFHFNYTTLSIAVLEFLCVPAKAKIILFVQMQKQQPEVAF